MKIRVFYVGFLCKNVIYANKSTAQHFVGPKKKTHAFRKALQTVYVYAHFNLFYIVILSLWTEPKKS